MSIVFTLSIVEVVASGYLVDWDSPGSPDVIVVAWGLPQGRERQGFPGSSRVEQAIALWNYHLSSRQRMCCLLVGLVSTVVKLLWPLKHMRQVHTDMITLTQYCTTYKISFTFSVICMRPKIDHSCKFFQYFYLYHLSQLGGTFFWQRFHRFKMKQPDADVSPPALFKLPWMTGEGF